MMRKTYSERKLNISGINTDSADANTYAAIIKHRKSIEGYLKRCDSVETHRARRYPGLQKEGKEKALLLEAERLKEYGLPADPKRLRKMLGDINTNAKKASKHKNVRRCKSLQRIYAENMENAFTEELERLRDEAIDNGCYELDEIESYIDRAFAPV